MIFLNRNEAPYDLPLEKKEKVAQLLIEQSWNRYPPMHCDPLKQALSRELSVEPERVLLGNGSAEVIQHLINLYRSQCNRLVFPLPSFEFFEQCGDMFDMEKVAWQNRPDMQYDYSNFPARNGSIYILCHPNNPSGDLLDIEFLMTYIENEPESLFIIDEAYIEFCSASLVALTDNHKNVVVTRTMSKAVGMAGVRLGYAICHPETANRLEEKQIPYRLNHFAMLMGLFIIEHCEQHVKDTVRSIISQRDSLFGALNKLFRGTSHKVHCSQGNFLLLYLDMEDPVATLMEHGICVGRVKHHPGYCRVSVGTAAENRMLIEVLGLLSAKVA